MSVNSRETRKRDRRKRDRRKGMVHSDKKALVDYFKSFQNNILRLIKFISCVITIFAPLMPWLKVSINKTTQPELHSYKDNLFALHGVETLFAILIMVLACIVIVLDMAEYVDAFGRIKNKWFYDPLIEILIYGALLMIVYLATVKTLTDEFEYYIAWIGGTVRRSAGCCIAWIGIVGITVTSIIAYGKKNKNGGK